MEAKHTPGPWEQITQHGAGPMIAHKYETGQQMNPTGLRLVCHVMQRGNSLEQDRANGRLIAAAPDLLEALLASVESVRKGPPEKIGYGETTGKAFDEGWNAALEMVWNALEPARAAIAKATA